MQSFSEKVKTEISDYEDMDNAESLLILAFTLASEAIFRLDTITLKVKLEDFAKLLNQALKSNFAFEFEVKELKTVYELSLNSKKEVDQVKAALEEVLGFSSISAKISKSATDFDQEERSTLLRAAFLAAASMANPLQSYQIEFNLSRKSISDFLEELLIAEDLEPLATKSPTHSILYLKEGDKIALFLAKIGAHKALLEFENIRVKKRVNEEVNRAVNCDNANIQRIAESSARQINLINKLNEANAYGLLPNDLRELADLRLQYPGYSLKELGELQEPSVSKSGMHHRFSKLEKWIRNYLNENQ